MKDKRVFFNPIRMISPKLDAETLKLENFHEHPVSENLTLEEGLLVMLSKLIEMSRLVRLGFLSRLSGRNSGLRSARKTSSRAGEAAHEQPGVRLNRPNRHV